MPISRFRAELKKWLERVQKGGELVITEHGKPIARITGAQKLTALERLWRSGEVSPAGTRKKILASSIKRVKPTKPVSPLISEMRD